MENTAQSSKLLCSFDRDLVPKPEVMSGAESFVCHLSDHNTSFTSMHKSVICPVSWDKDKSWQPSPRAGCLSNSSNMQDGHLSWQSQNCHFRYHAGGRWRIVHWPLYQGIRSVKFHTTRIRVTGRIRAIDVRPRNVPAQEEGVAALRIPSQRPNQTRSNLVTENHHSCSPIGSMWQLGDGRKVLIK